MVGVWVAAPESMTNVTASAPDFSAASALYVTAGEVESAQGGPFMVVYKGVPYPVASPEKYEVRFLQNGSNDEVYIALPNGHFAKFTKSSQAPSDYSTSAYSVASFLASRRGAKGGEFYRRPVDWTRMKMSLRKGDPALLLDLFRKAPADLELADLVDASSRRYRKGLRPR